MSILSKNRLWISILLVFFLVILILWIPLAWKHELILDKELFATEYYKFLVDIGKILFGFWLANIFFQRTQAKEFVLHFQQQWQDQKTTLLDSLKTLEIIPKSKDISIKDLKAKIELSDIKLSYLSEVISSYTYKDKLGSLGSISYEYKEDLHKHIKRILEALEKGEIIMLRPLDDEVIKSVKTLKVFLST